MTVMTRCTLCRVCACLNAAPARAGCRHRRTVKTFAKKCVTDLVDATIRITCAHTLVGQLRGSLWRCRCEVRETHFEYDVAIFVGAAIGGIVASCWLFVLWRCRATQERVGTTPNVGNIRTFLWKETRLDELHYLMSTHVIGFSNFVSDFLG